MVAALGSRKMWLYLRAKGHDVARCTIERLYREQGWEGARYGKAPNQAGTTSTNSRLTTLSWVHWFNETRLHGHYGDIPPAEYEAAFYAAQQAHPPGESNRTSLHQTQGGSLRPVVVGSLRPSTMLHRRQKDAPSAGPRQCVWHVQV